MKKSTEEISKTIGSIFIVMFEAGSSFKIDLIPKLSKSEIRNIKH